MKSVSFRHIIIANWNWNLLVSNVVNKGRRWGNKFTETKYEQIGIQNDETKNLNLQKRKK